MFKNEPRLTDILKHDDYKDYYLLKNLRPIHWRSNNLWLGECVITNRTVEVYEKDYIPFNLVSGNKVYIFKGAYQPKERVDNNENKNS